MVFVLIILTKSNRAGAVLRQKGIYMTFKEMRESLRWTQEKFAEYFKIPKRTIENWETGQRNCPEYLKELIEYKLYKEGLIVDEDESKEHYW